MINIPVFRNKKRLLHPGADTKDILTQYVSTIRCLRILDPPGVLLYKVADPIRRYLRSVVPSMYVPLADNFEGSDQILYDVLFQIWWGITAICWKKMSKFFLYRR